MITKSAGAALTMLGLYGDDVAIGGYRTWKARDADRKKRDKALARLKALKLELAPQEKTGSEQGKDKVLAQALKRALQLGVTTVPVSVLLHHLAPSVSSRKDLVRMPLTMAAGGAISGGMMARYKQTKSRGPVMPKIASDMLLYSTLASGALPGARAGGNPDDNPYLKDVVYARHRLAQQAIKDAAPAPRGELAKNMALGGAAGAAIGPVATQILAHRLPPSMAAKLTGANKGAIGAGLGAGIGMYAAYKKKKGADQVRAQAQDYMSFYQGRITPTSYKDNAMPITKTSADSIDRLTKQLAKSLKAGGKAIPEADKAFRAKREWKLNGGEYKSKLNTLKASPKGKYLAGAGAAIVAGTGLAALHASRKKRDELSPKTAGLLSNLLKSVKKAPPIKKTVKVNTRDWRVPGVPTGSTAGSSFDAAVSHFDPRAGKLIGTKA
jgi:hypothetical protein